MDNTRIIISLEQGERSALMQYARTELRTPRDQARHIIRCELVRLGWLTSEGQPNELSARTVPTDLTEPDNSKTDTEAVQ